MPEALLNYLVRLDWSHGDQAVFTFEEMIRFFDIADVMASASAFNPDKLRMLNQQRIIAMPAEALGQRLSAYLEQARFDPQNGPAPAKLTDGFCERADTLVQMAESTGYYFAEFDEIEPKAAKKHLRPGARDRIGNCAERRFPRIRNLAMLVDRLCCDV